MSHQQKTLHLVDSISYARSNCFQRQLLTAFERGAPETVTVALPEFLASDVRYDRIICCLKQRTVNARLTDLAERCSSMPVVVYDQDPWQAYMDDSPLRGVYERVASKLNVTSFSVTTRWWASYIAARGLPAQFVPMWILPEYCSVGPAYDDRSISVGFIGTAHPYRRRLFDELLTMGINVVHTGNTLDYPDYLRNISNIKVFIHSEDFPITVDGSVLNLKDALWIKDVEAASQGCFTLRNKGSDPESYYDGIETTRLYDSVTDIPDIIHAIENMDPEDRNGSIKRSVEFIKKADRWQETVRTLLT